METLQNAIITAARRDIGQREIPPNKGFVNPDFEAALRAVGWQTGWAWCAMACKRWWSLAYQETLPEMLKDVQDCFSPAVQATERRFRRTFPQCVSQAPALGALAVFHSGSTAKGHIGVVTVIGQQSFQSIEGNTNADGGREGIEVALRTRKLDFTKKDNGLWLACFIHPPTRKNDDQNGI